MYRSIVPEQLQRVQPYEVILCNHDSEGTWQYNLALNIHAPTSSHQYIHDDHLWEYILESRPRWFVLHVVIPDDVSSDPVLFEISIWVIQHYYQIFEYTGTIEPTDTQIDQMLPSDQSQRYRLKFMIQFINAQDEQRWVRELINTLLPDPPTWLHYIQFEINMQTDRYELWPLQTMDDGSDSMWNPLNYEVRFYNTYSYLIGVYPYMEEHDDPLSQLAGLSLNDG